MSLFQIEKNLVHTLNTSFGLFQEGAVVTSGIKHYLNAIDYNM